MAKIDVTLECSNEHSWFSDALIFFPDEVIIEEPECPECGQTWEEMRASLPDRERGMIDSDATPAGRTRTSVRTMLKPRWYAG